MHKKVWLFKIYSFLVGVIGQNSNILECSQIPTVACSSTKHILSIIIYFYGLNVAINHLEKTRWNFQKSQDSNFFEKSFMINIQTKMYENSWRPCRIFYSFLLYLLLNSLWKISIKLRRIVDCVITVSLRKV